MDNIRRLRGVLLDAGVGSTFRFLYNLSSTAGWGSTCALARACRALPSVGQGRWRRHHGQTLVIVVVNSPASLTAFGAGGGLWAPRHSATCGGGGTDNG